MMETFKQLITERDRLVSKIKYALNEHNPDLEPAIASFFQELEETDKEITRIGQQLIQEKIICV